MGFQLCPLTQCYFLHLANTHSTETAAICLVFSRSTRCLQGYGRTLCDEIYNITDVSFLYFRSAVIWGMPPFHEILSIKMCYTNEKSGTHDTQSEYTGPSGAG